MSERDDTFRWVLSGKQVGARTRFQRTGEVFWTSVGVQLWCGQFRVYVDEIAESLMDAEEYAREETLNFTTLEEAAQYVDAHTEISFCQLRPCKGQKIFNPAFSST